MSTIEEEGISTLTGEGVVSPSDVLYWTCKQANAYIASLSGDVQTRYAALQKQRGITIPDTDAALRSAQMEIIMDAI